MNIKERFNKLVKQYEDETLFSAFVETDHPAYKEILSMGWLAVPRLLQEMDGPSSYWFSALSDITKQWPVGEEDAGNMGVICDAWVRWGKEHSTLVAILSGLEDLITTREPFALVEILPPSKHYEHGVFTIDTYLGRDQELYIEGDEYGYLDACVSEMVEKHDHVEDITNVEDFLLALNNLSS